MHSTDVTLTGKHQTSHRRFIPIYAVTLLFVLQSFLVSYVNSSYLEQYLSKAGIGLIYTVGSAFSVFIFLFISRVLHAVGNYKLTMGLLFTLFFVTIGLTTAESLRTAVPLFVVFLVINPLIIFNLDVFMEELIGNNESSTGTRRGLMLSMMSLIGAIAPLITGQIIDIEKNGFDNAYILSALTLLPIMCIMMYYFRNFQDPAYPEIKVLSAIRTFWERKDVRSVFLSNFLLQIFFMFMVVYVPLYLIGEIGLNWQQFGIVIFFAQLAYVFFEYPIGLIADKKYGEKEMMALGFLILALSSASIAYLSDTGVLAWIILMFISRIGASLVEVTTESFFFKQTTSSDAQIISFFRVTRPMSYMIGTVFGSFLLLYLPFNLIFVVLGILMIPGILLAISITDSL